MSRYDADIETLLSLQCGTCAAQGVRLWRPYQGSSPLLCREHAEVERAKDDADEQVSTASVREIETDQIGWRVPAVPVGDTFWGYTSVPQAMVIAWNTLPTVAGPSSDELRIEIAARIREYEAGVKLILHQTDTSRRPGKP